MKQRIKGTVNGASTNTNGEFNLKTKAKFPFILVISNAAIAVLASKRNSQQTRYRVYTNAKNKYNNYGLSLGITYNFYESYTVVSNVSYNNITKNKQADVFVTGFNTPQWSTNLSSGNHEIAKNLGFNVTWKWQQEFLSESPLVKRAVPAFNTFDTQVSYRIPSSKTTLKLGGTNLLNKNYVQYAGGPTLGALYYAAVTIDGLLIK